MAKSCKMHLYVDVIAFLEKKMKSNTEHYQADFEIDKEMFRKFVTSEHKEDKTLLWMSRPCGTHCNKEFEAFIQGTYAHHTWRFYAEQTKDPIVAYSVELIDMNDGIIRGNCAELDYAAFAAEVAQKSVAPSVFRKTFEDGFVIDVPVERSSSGYYYELVAEHGRIVDSLALPKDKDQHAAILAEQKAKRTKMRVAKTAKPSLSAQIQAAAGKTDALNEHNHKTDKEVFR